MIDFFFAIGILTVLFGVIHYYEKWAKDGPKNGRGLKGIAQDYFLKILSLTQSLTEEQRNFLLEKAYHKIKQYQKEYNPKYDVKFLHILFDDEYKDSVRIECFAISFILCHPHRSYGSDELGRKMATIYYDALECRLGELYDYCIINNKYFPMEIVNCFCSDGNYILKKHSEHFSE